MKLRAMAPGKVNLCLFVGERRDDGRHELVTLIESVSLADELCLSVGSPGDSDSVECPRVEGPNLVSRALTGLRARGWDAPAVRVTIDKRIPVAAGMGGGSADAAAMLRMAPLVAPIGEDQLGELAAELGSDVPSQLAPGLVLGVGGGERVRPCEPLASHAFLILQLAERLSTADVYAEADRLGLTRTASVLADRLQEVDDELRPGLPLPGQLIENDLQSAAVSLCPEIEPVLDNAFEAGAELAFVCGSGPTVAGLYWGSEALDRAQAAADVLVERFSGAFAAVPVDAGFGSPLFA